MNLWDYAALNSLLHHKKTCQKAGFRYKKMTNKYLQTASGIYKEVMTGNLFTK